MTISTRKGKPTSPVSDILGEGAARKERKRQTTFYLPESQVFSSSVLGSTNCGKYDKERNQLWLQGFAFWRCLWLFTSLCFIGRRGVAAYAETAGRD